MHSACQIGNARIGHRSRHGQSALVGSKLMSDSSAFWMKLFERADPTENTRPAQSILSYSPVPRLVCRSRVLGLQHFQCAANQRIDAVFNIGLLVKQLDVDWYTLALVAH